MQPQVLCLGVPHSAANPCGCFCLFFFFFPLRLPQSLLPFPTPKGARACPGTSATAPVNEEIPSSAQLSSLSGSPAQSLAGRFPAFLPAARSRARPRPPFVLGVAASRPSSQGGYWGKLQEFPAKVSAVGGSWRLLGGGEEGKSLEVKWAASLPHPGGKEKMGRESLSP